MRYIHIKKSLENDLDDGYVKRNLLVGFGTSVFMYSLWKLIMELFAWPWLELWRTNSNGVIILGIAAILWGILLIVNFNREYASVIDLGLLQLYLYYLLSSLMLSQKQSLWPTSADIENLSIFGWIWGGNVVQTRKEFFISMMPSIYRVLVIYVGLGIIHSFRSESPFSLTWVSTFISQGLTRINSSNEEIAEDGSNDNADSLGAKFQFMFKIVGGLMTSALVPIALEFYRTYSNWRKNRKIIRFINLPWWIKNMPWISAGFGVFSTMAFWLWPFWMSTISAILKWIDWAEVSDTFKDSSSQSVSPSKLDHAKELLFGKAFLTLFCVLTSLGYTWVVDEVDYDDWTYEWHEW